VVVGFYFALQPKQSWPSFTAYLDHLASLPAGAIREQLLDAYARIPPRVDGVCQEMQEEPLPVDYEAVLHSADSYLAFLQERFDPDVVDEELERRAYQLLSDPPALQEFILSHLRHMWDRYLVAEWRRVEPMLVDAVEAFAAVDLQEMGRLEAAEFVTGCQDVERWGAMLQRAEKGEQRSQEIMERLELSQSATSRHLKQLSATGYLAERRCAGPSVTG
jgi:hypothetical protein